MVINVIIERVIARHIRYADQDVLDASRIQAGECFLQAKSERGRGVRGLCRRVEFLSRAEHETDGVTDRSFVAVRDRVDCLMNRLNLNISHMYLLFIQQNFNHH